MPFAKSAKATPTYFGSLTGALCIQSDCGGNVNPDNSLIAFLKECWKGNKPLYVAFWWVTFGGNLFLYMLIFAAALIISNSGVSAAVVLFFVLMNFIWSIFGLVCIWKCSRNTSNKIWTDLSKIFILFVVIVLPFLTIFT